MAHRQPRGNKIAQLLSEYERRTCLPCGSLCPIDGKNRMVNDVLGVPKKSKLLAFSDNKGGLWEKIIQPLQRSVGDCACGYEAPPGRCTRRWFLIGVFRSPAEWHRQACLLPFPMDQAQAVRPWQAAVLVEIFKMSPAELVASRAKGLKYLMETIVRLNRDEMLLHETLDNHVAKILAGKRLLLLQNLMSAAGVSDVRLISDIKKGFDLTGTVPDSGLFDLKDEPLEAKLSVEELLRQSRWKVPEAVANARPSGDEDDDDRLLGVCEDEVSKGWAAGPYTVDQVNSLHGEGRWIAARRFGIWQSSAGKQKYRPIDDYTRFGQNSTATVVEKLNHSGLDEVIGVAKVMIAAIATGWIHFLDSDGTVWDGPVNKAWCKAKVVGRTLDLKSAYKQLAISSHDLPMALTCIYHPRWKKAAFYQNYALPFGAVASVYAFNRCARTLEMVVNKHAMVATSSYFDDFPQLDLDLVAKSGEHSTETLLDALGWKFDSEGDKYRHCQAAFTVLGAQVDLRQDHIVVQNLPRRWEQVREQVDDILNKGEWTSLEAMRLTGRLNYVRTMVSGKPLICEMHTLYQKAAMEDKKPKKISEEEMTALRFTLQLAATSKPRRVKCIAIEPPTILYTDGALEKGIATAGAVLCQPGLPAKVISYQLNQSLLDQWSAVGSIHCIAQVELHPVIVAKKTWKNELFEKDVIHFTDINAVKEALVKGHSSSLASRRMLHELSSIELILNGRVWICRVPSESNPADAPSRSQESTLDIGLPWVPCKPEINNGDM